MTNTTFRERLVIELNNAECKYDELMAVAELQEDDDVWASISNEADQYWQVAQACRTLLNAQNNEII